MTRILRWLFPLLAGLVATIYWGVLKPPMAASNAALEAQTAALEARVTRLARALGDGTTDPVTLAERQRELDTQIAAAERAFVRTPPQSDLFDAIDRHASDQGLTVQALEVRDPTSLDLAPDGAFALQQANLSATGTYAPIQRFLFALTNGTPRVHVTNLELTVVDPTASDPTLTLNATLLASVLDPAALTAADLGIDEGR
jgi:hypothetical protein